MSSHLRLDDAFFGALNLVVPYNIDGTVLIIGKGRELAESFLQKSNSVIELTKISNNSVSFRKNGSEDTIVSVNTISDILESIKIIVTIDPVSSKELLNLGLAFSNLKMIVGKGALCTDLVSSFGPNKKIKYGEVFLRTTGEVFSQNSFNNTVLFPLRMYFEKGLFVKNMLLRSATFMPSIYSLVFNNKLSYIKHESDCDESLLTCIFRAIKSILDDRDFHVQRCLVSSAHVVIMEVVSNLSSNNLLVRVPLNDSSKKRFKLNHAALVKLEGVYMGIKSPEVIVFDSCHKDIFSIETMLTGQDSWELNDKVTPTRSAATSLISSISDKQSPVLVDEYFIKQHVAPYFDELIRVDILNDVEAENITSNLYKKIQGSKVSISRRHGDFKLENMLFYKGNVVGIFDFDLFCEEGIAILELMHLIGSNYYIENVNNIDELVTDVLLPFRLKLYETQLFEKFPGFAGFSHPSWHALVLLYWLDHMVSRHVSIVKNKASISLKNRIRHFLLGMNKL